MLAIIIKASIVIFVLLAFYKLVLEKESFFKMNRMYLLSCLILAGVLPFIAMPKLMEHQGVVANWINPSLEDTATSNEIGNYPQINIEESSGDYEVTITTPEVEHEEAGASINKVDQERAPANSKGLMYWLTLIYLFGVGVLTLNLLAQVVGTLYQVFKNTDRIEDGDSVIVNLTSDTEPCSFFKYIFINPSMYDYETYEQIVEHEKIHVEQKHTWDLLVSEIAVILLWFNPFMWILRKEVEKNIEYQTDDILVNGRQEIKEGYQINLVNIAARTKPLAITTNYNQSLIKQRILKMNSKKSNKYNYWKYAFMAPLLFVMLLLLNEPQSAFAQVNGPLADTSISSDNQLTTDLDTLGDRRISTIINTTTSGTINTPKSTRDARADENSLISEVNVRDENRLNNSECRKLLDAIRSSDISLVKALIIKGDVNCIDHKPGYEEVQGSGRRWKLELMKTPLMATAKNGNVEIAKLLVKAGAEVDMEVHGDATALVIAASFGQVDMMKYLINEGADLNQENPNYGNILLAASGSGNLEAVKFVAAHKLDINHYSPNQGTPLIQAAGSGNLDGVKFLVDEGADVNFHAPNQGTPLIAASQMGQLEIVKFLISKGAKVDFVAPNQGNAIIAASGNGRLNVVKYLVTEGADVNAYTPNQGTPLIMAANNGFLETVKYLMEEDADIDFLSPNQGTALSRASLNGHSAIARLLSSKVKDINVMSDGQGSALIAAARNGRLDLVELYLDKGANINQNSDAQGFALNAAATNGINEVISFLLERGADINLQNDGQGSALNAAARNGHDHTIRLLLENGANINLQNDGQGSALNAAARNGRMSTVKLLIELGADVNLYSDGQGTALSAASRNRHQDVVDYLESKGAKHIYGQ